MDNEFWHKVLKVIVVLALAALGIYILIATFPVMVSEWESHRGFYHRGFFTDFILLVLIVPIVIIIIGIIRSFKD